MQGAITVGRMLSHQRCGSRDIASMPRSTSARHHARDLSLSPSVDVIVRGQSAMSNRGAMSSALTAEYQGQDEKPKSKASKNTAKNDCKLGVLTGAR